MEISVSFVYSYDFLGKLKERLASNNLNPLRKLGFQHEAIQGVFWHRVPPTNQATI